MTGRQTCVTCGYQRFRITGLFASDLFEAFCSLFLLSGLKGNVGKALCRAGIVWSNSQHAAEIGFGCCVLA